jgi:hypothetical protein
MTGRFGQLRRTRHLHLLPPFFLLLIVLYFLEPEFNPPHLISEYELGRFGWLMSLAFFCLGMGSLCLLGALWSDLQTKGGHLSTSPSSFLVVRVHADVPRSPCALVSARPHPQAAAQDRRDTAARRRVLLRWRDCDGARQVTCAWLRAVRHQRARVQCRVLKAAIGNGRGRYCEIVGAAHDHLPMCRASYRSEREGVGLDPRLFGTHSLRRTNDFSATAGRRQLG